MPTSSIQVIHTFPCVDTHIAGWNRGGEDQSGSNQRVISSIPKLFYEDRRLVAVRIRNQLLSKVKRTENIEVWRTRKNKFNELIDLKNLSI